MGRWERPQSGETLRPAIRGVQHPPLRVTGFQILDEDLESRSDAHLEITFRGCSGPKVMSRHVFK